MNTGKKAPSDVCPSLFKEGTGSRPQTIILQGIGSGLAQPPATEPEGPASAQNQRQDPYQGMSYQGMS